jgi:hypothetical protein
MYRMRITRYSLCLLLLSLSPTARAQEAPCCQQWQSYVPLPAEHTPVQTIQLAVHVMQAPDTVINFEDTPDHRQYLINLVQDAGQSFRNLEPMQAETSSAYIPDGRIDFWLDWGAIYFHAVPDWDFSELNLNQQIDKVTGWHRRFVLEDTTLQHRQDAVHLFLVSSDSLKAKDLKSRGVASGIASRHWVVAQELYHDYRTGYWPRGIISHELGHSMGLHHTTSNDRPLNDGCDDTPTYPAVKNCWSCGNNIMDYNKWKNALTECQLGRLHLALNGLQGDIAEAVFPRHCDPEHWQNLSLPPDTSYTWCGRKKLTGHLIVGENTELYIHCRVHLPPGAKIVLLPGARLVVAGGHLTCPCPGGQWAGILALRKGKRAGKLVVEQGAALLNTSLPPGLAQKTQRWSKNWKQHLRR